MKDKMERLLVLPFTAGCISPSSVAVSYSPSSSSNSPQPKRAKLDPLFHSSSVLVPSSGLKHLEKVKDQEAAASESMKLLGSLKLPDHFIKPNFGVLKMLKSFKISFSQLFVLKEENEAEDEMEIGHPTDVQHVSHIGADGSHLANTIKGWDYFMLPHDHHHHDFLSFTHHPTFASHSNSS